MKNYIQYFYDGGKYTREQIKSQQKFLKDNYGYTGAIDGLWTMKDRSKKSRTQIAAEKAEADGYIIDENGNFVEPQPKDSDDMTNIMGTTTLIITTGGGGYVPPSITVRSPSVYVSDNMYPYSYGDILINTQTGESIPYDGGTSGGGRR